MIIALDKNEYVALMLHCEIMKKPIKKVLKKNYGKSYKGHYSAFSSAADKLKKAQGDDDEKEYYHLDFTEKETQVMYDFLKSYIVAMEDKGEEEGLNKEQKEQLHELIKSLETIKGYFKYKEVV